MALLLQERPTDHRLLEPGSDAALPAIVLPTPTPPRMTPAPPQPAPTKKAAGLLKAARPYQWAKNGAVLMIPALVLPSLTVAGVAAAAGAVLAFCLAASSVYLLNDTADREADRQHPVKRNRPIASGLVGPRLALGTAAVTAAGAIGLGFLITPSVGVIVTLYLTITMAYSLALKDVPVLDVTVLAAGFVLRVLAGAAAVGTVALPLLLVAVFWGAVFIALGKRRSESVLLGDRAADHRTVLTFYTVPLLDWTLLDAELVAILAFAAWTFTMLGGLLGAGLALLAALSLHTALDAYRRALVGRGAGGDPTRELASNHLVLASLALTGVIAMSAAFLP